MSQIEALDRWRLGLHLMPPKGWLNDPNGLCQFQGIYHVFFQYSPDNPEGGMKYWGHYTSKDMLTWEFCGVSLYPDTAFDKNGVYSGSALIAEGKMNLYYTGNVKLQGDYNYITDGRQGNTILVSSKDGMTFQKKECLMTNENYPTHLTCHVRDPKVVTAESIGISDNLYYMFLGARTKEDVGEVLLYKSEDLVQWEFVHVLKSEHPLGYMWECPDAFLVEQKKLLCISPQGVKQEGINFQNLYQSGYYEVEGDYSQEYQLNNFKEWDRGFDFYAPQTFQDEKGRRILVGWIGMPDDLEQSNPTVECGWQNALTLPREIKMKKDKIIQYPVAEIKKLRRESEPLEVGVSSKELKYYEAQIAVKEESDIQIIISDGVELYYNKEQKLFGLHFDQNCNLGYGRKARHVTLEYCEEITIFADTSCLEIYLNNGEEVFTTRFYTESGTSHFIVKTGNVEIKYWELKPMEMIYNV